MLSARAYSFRQKSRLAITLSWVSGYTNVVALLAFGSMVSHITGSVTNVGRYLGTGQFRQASFFAFLVLTFFSGAVISAFLIESASRHGNPSKYVMPIVLELLLLTGVGLSFLAHPLSELKASAGWTYALTGLASLSMGVQNATITKISGSVVRTTHLTGVVTDLGLEGVQYLSWWHDRLRSRWAGRPGRLLKVSQRHPTGLRLMLLASIAGSFAFGATVGGLVFAWSPGAVIVPVALFLGWIVLVDLRSPIADIRELDPLSDPELRAHGIIKSLLPAQIGIFRAANVRGVIVSHPYRAPNFQVWVKHLPAHQRVVILAIGVTMRFDANTVMDIEQAVKTLHDTGRKLVVAGVTVSHFKTLNEYGVARMMDASNLCPDLEFALARAMAVLELMNESPPPPRSGPRPVADQGASSC